MWAAIIALAALAFASCDTKACCGEQANMRKGMMQRLEMGNRPRRGSKGDTGRGAWLQGPRQEKKEKKQKREKKHNPEK